MSLTIERIAIPTFKRSLLAISAFMVKGEAYTKEQGIDPSVLVNASLAEDMHPLSRQIQMLTDTVRRGLCQLGGAEVVSVADTEQSFAELQQRLQSTLDFIDTFDTATLAQSEDKIITLPMGPTSLELDGTTYLMSFVMPNFYFHAAAAYNILRNKGVDVGKMDFLGQP